MPGSYIGTVIRIKPNRLGSHKRTNSRRANKETVSRTGNRTQRTSPKYSSAWWFGPAEQTAHREQRTENREMRNEKSEQRRGCERSRLANISPGGKTAQARAGPGLHPRSHDFGLSGNRAQVKRVCPWSNGCTLGQTGLPVVKRVYPW